MNAMSGADSAMHMYSVMGSGKDFEEAFEMTYDYLGMMLNLFLLNM